MTDPRVELLARKFESMDDEWEPPLPPSYWADQARRFIAHFEAAGLIVLADPDIDALACAARVAFFDAVRGPTASTAWFDVATAVLAALRSSPPADFPAAGGAPGDGAETQLTHDGVRRDKAIRPRSSYDPATDWPDRYPDGAQ